LKGAAEVGDATIEFLLEGAGDAVVVIPGGGLDASYFEELARRIAGAGFRAVAVNPRGVGASKGRLAGLTLHTLAGDVAAVIEALGSGPAHVVGHGFSNRVARCLAVDRPELVRSVILLAGVDSLLPSLRSSGRFRLGSVRTQPRPTVWRRPNNSSPIRQRHKKSFVK
jgi:pimeloyl-ACP methyl ester carboxylesterase